MKFRGNLLNCAEMHRRIPLQIFGGHFGEIRREALLWASVEKLMFYEQFWNTGVVFVVNCKSILESMPENFLTNIKDFFNISLKELLHGFY